jgi:serine protease Do
LILSVNDRAVDQPGDLVRAIGDTKPGQAVALKIWRKGATRELSAKLVEMAPEKTAAAEPAE